MSEKDESRRDYNGGKWPNREGAVAIPEFIDSAGSSGTQNSVANPAVDDDPNAPSSVQPFRESAPSVSKNEAMLFLGLLLSFILGVVLGTRR